MNYSLLFFIHVRLRHIPSLHRAILAFVSDIPITNDSDILLLGGSLDTQRIINIALMLRRLNQTVSVEEKSVRDVALISSILFRYDPAFICRLFDGSDDIQLVEDEYEIEACEIFLCINSSGITDNLWASVKGIFDRYFAEDFDSKRCQAWSTTISVALLTGAIEYHPEGFDDRRPWDGPPQNAGLVESSSTSAEWIGVDLDGTLAEYNEWQGLAHIGPVIPKMAARVKQWLHEGKQVKIFTARAIGGEVAVLPIQQWLQNNGLPALEVTNVKDFRMTELWDDRCVQVETNTGVAVGLPNNPLCEAHGSEGE